MVEWKKLGDVCKDVIVPMRDRPKVFDGTTPWCRIEDIEGMYFNKSLSGLMVSDSVIKQMNLKVFPTGTVICSCSATLGVCAINTQPLITNQTFIGLVCSNQVNNRYLYYYMLTRKKELFSLSTTGTIPYVSRDKFEKMIIPIPSISEQERIVSILDTFTSSIDNLKQQIAQRRKQYEYYRDQLLDLEGKEGVEMKLLSSISTIKVGPFGSLIHKKDYVSGGIPLVNPVQMNNGYIVRDDSFSVSEETAKLLEGYTLYSGDIVFARRGEIGRCAIVTEKESNFICGTGSLIVRFKKMVNSKFMLFMFNTPNCKRYLLKSAIGGSMLNINCDIVGKMQIPVPPLSEQQRIVSILDTFEASIQNLEAQLSQREKQYEYYRNKLLTFE